MGATWECISFVTRALATRHQQSLALLIVSQLLFLLAPLLVNAYAYMVVGRMIHFWIPDHRIGRIKGASVAKYFVWADILSFLVQGTGGSMINPSNSPQAQQNGLHIYMGGVGLQEFFIVIFVGLIAVFHRKALRLEQAGQMMRRESWRGLTYVLYAVLVFITVSLTRPVPFS
jgi:hypothetical protein